MTNLTPEQLDEARAKEAYRIWSGSEQPMLERTSVCTIAARLAREGWQPVDPLLVKAREIVAGWWDERHRPDIAKDILTGEADICEAVACTYRALKSIGDNNE